MEKSRVILRVQPWDVMIRCVLIGVLGDAMLIPMYVITLLQTPDETKFTIYGILFFLIVFTFVVGSLIVTGKRIQWAIVTEEGVEIRCVWTRMAKFKWEDLTSVLREVWRYERNPYLKKDKYPHFEWLVFRTGKGQKPHIRQLNFSWIGNVRNKPPWVILALPQNVAEIEKYVTVRYAKGQSREREVYNRQQKNQQ